MPRLASDGSETHRYPWSLDTKDRHPGGLLLPKTSGGSEDVVSPSLDKALTAVCWV